MNKYNFTMKITILFYLATFSSPSYSINSLHIIDHLYPGCPTNSTCTKKLGQKRLLFNTQIKKGLYAKAKKRIPFEIWVNVKDEISQVTHGKRPWDSQAISWDSSCQRHHTKKYNYEIGQITVKSPQKLADTINSDPHFYLERTYTLLKDKILKYPIPVAEIPQFIQRERLHFTRQDENIYYGLTVDKNSALDIVSIQKETHLPRDVTCPKKLTQLFLEETAKMSGLYADHFCKAIWDRTQKKYRTFLFGWTCP